MEDDSRMFHEGTKGGSEHGGRLEARIVNQQDGTWLTRDVVEEEDSDEEKGGAIKDLEVEIIKGIEDGGDRKEDHVLQVHAQKSQHDRDDNEPHNVLHLHIQQP